MSKFNVGPLECCCKGTVTAQHFSTPACSKRLASLRSSLKGAPDVTNIGSFSFLQEHKWERLEEGLRFC